MENINSIKVQIDIPPEFNKMLDEWLVNLKAQNVRTSKAKEIIKFAWIGFNAENNGKTK